MYRKDKRTVRNKSSTKHISHETLLQLLKIGTVLTVAIVAPKSLRLLKSLLKKEETWNDYYSSSLDRGINRLWRKGFVEVNESNSGYEVKITNKGKTEVLKYDLNEMIIPKPRSWDGKWRMVIFDIPAGEKVRHLFRKQLKMLGLYQIQESVYVYPYPCEKEIIFLREVYAIPHDVKLAKIDRLENDAELRRYFSL